MPSETESVSLTSCTAFIEEKTKRLRKRKPDTKPPKKPPKDDDYGFAKSRNETNRARSPRPRHPPEAGQEHDDRGRRAAGNGVTSGGNIPITLGCLGDDGGFGSLGCSLDHAERTHAGGSRSDSPWSEMSIHLVTESQHSEYIPQRSNARAAESIGKYYCHERRSRSVGPVRRGVGEDMNFYSGIRNDVEAAGRARRSRSEYRTSAAGASPRSAGSETRSLQTAERPSRSLSRRRNDGGHERCTSTSREIIALYTRRSSTPVARASVASSTATLRCGGGSDGQSVANRERAPRSKSAAAPRCGTAFSNAGRDPFSRPASQRSASQPRPQTSSSMASSTCTLSSRGWQSPRQRSLAGADVVAENLRVWAKSTTRTPLSVPRESRAAALQGPERSTPFTAVLEMDRDVNARVETFLNHSNSIRPADVRVMAIASYKPAVNSWATEDEVTVAAGTIVLAKYKQNEWLYVVAPDGREGFMPFAYTKPIKADDRATGFATAEATAPHKGEPQRAVRSVASTESGSVRRERKSEAAVTSSSPGSRSSSRVAMSSPRDRRHIRHRQSTSGRASVLLGTEAPITPHRGWREPEWERQAGDASQVLRFRQVWDTSSAISSDDSVFYEACLAADLDGPSASDSEDWRASARSTPSGQGASAASDYYGAFFSDSGISEPCSELLVEDGGSSKPLGKSRAAAAASFDRNREAAERSKDVRKCAKKAQRLGSRGRAETLRRGSNELRADESSRGGRCVYRTSSDARDRAKTSGARSSFCPDITRDYGGPTATVVYDYDVDSADDVCVRAGENVCVLNEDDSQWIWVQKRDGSEGFIPKDNVLFLPFRRQFLLDKVSTSIVAAV